MVSGQTLPPSAEAYRAALERENRGALSAIGRLWSRMSLADIQGSWDAISPQVTSVVMVAQARVAGLSGPFMTSVLRETNQDAAAAREWDPIVSPLVGHTGDGREVAGLMRLTPGKAFRVPGVAPTLNDLVEAEKWLNVAATSTIADTARQSETLQMATRPKVTRYVRMITAGACSRCAILAGVRYRKREAFDRHPGCQCVHIPESEAAPGDWRLDPKVYFDTLPPAEQARVFTKAGAEAIHAGADPSRVVNARRGMSTASQNQRGWIPKGQLTREDVYGQRVFTTTEATTRRGSASRQATGRRGTTRLMPESIVELAESPADLERMLRLHGYIA